MHLKRLELAGFKSFAQKTVLEFPAGITAIVGPNGSGKSNIIDAFRWILGEREAKQMRGARAEDLIFAGTGQHAAMSLAQATLIFDNASKFFPVDYTEVSIRRRIGRDGISQYFLNDAEVRLKDVLDFFAKSRLGTKGFSIVNQGDTDLFVRALPKDRRAMLEEILGLREFQIKKHDAELKLKNTQINLDKAKALTEEMLPHLRLLRRQTSRWAKHGELEQELRELEARYFGAKIAELAAEEQRFAPEREKLDRELAAKQAELKKLEEKLRDIERVQPSGDKGFAEIVKKRNELLETKTKAQRGLGRLEAQIEFLAERAETPVDAEKVVGFLDELRANLQELTQAEDVDEVKAALEQIIGEIDALLSAGGKEEDEEAQEKVKESKEQLSAELADIDRKLKELASAERKVAEGYEGFNVEFRRAFALVDAKKNEIAAVERKRSKIAIEEERVRMRREELRHQAEQYSRKLEEFEGTRPPAGFEAAGAERRILKLRGELAAIGEIDEGLVKEAEATEERYEFLSKQVEDSEKASKDLKFLVRELDHKIHNQFTNSLWRINEEFHKLFQLMFGGGRAKLALVTWDKGHETRNETESGEPSEKASEDEDSEHAIDHGGLEIELAIPRKKIKGLDMLSGGERSLVSIAVLFALISVSPPPFIVLDEADAALDEANTRRFADLVQHFAKKTQFVIVTHNRATMEAADVLYGVTMKDDGTSRVLSLKLE